MDWQRFFEEHILERGYDYYCNSAVNGLNNVNDALTATVAGTVDYFVRVSFDGDRITDMNCTCPYAADGNYCKHMAAVLFKHEELKHSSATDECHISGHTNVPADKSATLKEVVANMGTETLRKELLAILENDRNLSVGFMLRHNRNDESMSQYITNIREKADIILRQCADHHGFVNWRNASSFASRLIGEVICELKDFTADDEEAKVAFDVSLYVYCLFADTDIDDSGGETPFFTGECIELWEQIIANAENRDLLEHILSELTQTRDKLSSGEYMADEINTFISTHFNDNGFALTKLESIDRRIELLANERSWHNDYELSKSVKERLKLMEELGHSKGDVIEFRTQYWHLPMVREIVMSELEAAGNLPDLIKLLEESKEMDRGFPGLVRKYSAKLTDCYFKDGWFAKAKEELFTYVTEYNRGDLDAFKKLRQNTPFELWPRKRKEVFDALSAQGVDLKHLLAAEGLKKQLFNSLVAQVRERRGIEKHTLSDLIEHEAVLRPEYENELLDMYEKLIWQISEFAGGRAHYQEIVRFIGKMFSYPEGKLRARKMLEQWRFTYSNRPAMQDELQVLYRDL